MVVVAMMVMVVVVVMMMEAAAVLQNIACTGSRKYNKSMSLCAFTGNEGGVGNKISAVQWPWQKLSDLCVRMMQKIKKKSISVFTDPSAINSLHPTGVSTLSSRSYISLMPWPP